LLLTEGMLSIRARNPPIQDIADVLAKFKVSFNLLVSFPVSTIATDVTSVWSVCPSVRLSQSLDGMRRHLYHSTLKGDLDTKFMFLF